MSVKSVFEFKFPKSAQEEGLIICLAIGHDMTEKNGYLHHEVLQDLKDPGHLTVGTLWQSQAESDAVLSKYLHDDKITKATKLIGSSPVGFVGEVLSNTV